MTAAQPGNALDTTPAPSLSSVIEQDKKVLGKLLFPSPINKRTIRIRIRLQPYRTVTIKSGFSRGHGNSIPTFQSDERDFEFNRLIALLPEETRSRRAPSNLIN